MEEEYDLEIKPKGSFFSLNLKELIDYRDLLIMFVKRDIVTVYKQTILGPIWFVVQPIMTMLVYVVVFGNIANISTDGIPQPIFYLCGIIIWNYFSDTFNETSKTFTSNADMFGKVYFPRLIAPLSKVTSGLIKFLIQFILFLGVYFYFTLIKGMAFDANIWLLIIPYLLVLMGGLGLGLGLVFSSLTTKYRDLTFLLQFGVQLLMYGTPIIYPMSEVKNPMLKTIIGFNPIAHIVEMFKYAFLGVGEVSLYSVLYSTGFVAITFLLGVFIFNKTERNFMDTV